MIEGGSWDDPLPEDNPIPVRATFRPPVITADVSSE
jgi:hypothetical protein